MDTQIKDLYDNLRIIKDGKLVIFLGAGASYDYGIPTMYEMAKMLMDEISRGGNKYFDKNATKVLLCILGKKPEEDGKKIKGGNQYPKWNIEDLLTRLHQIKEAIEGSEDFPKVETKIGELEISKEEIFLVEEKLLEFIIDCYKLDANKRTEHGDGNVEYIAEFIKLISEFVRSIRIITTNNDLCIEASLVLLSQHKQNGVSKKYYLVDGFSHGLIPTFSIENFAIEKFGTHDTVPLYLWKMHGSIDWIFTNSFRKKTNESNIFNDESIICKMTSESLCKDLFEAGAIAEDISKDKSKIMIFPTPTKYSQTYTFPYMDLYESFRRILEESELLLAIGTSFPDRHINSAIKSFLRRDNTHLYLVDPEITDEGLRKIFGELKTIKPVIKSGFKTFVELISKLEKEEILEETND